MIKQYFPISVKVNKKRVGIARLKDETENYLELIIIPTKRNKRYYHLVFSIKIPYTHPKLGEMKTLNVTNDETIHLMNTSIQDYEQLLDNHISSSEFELEVSPRVSYASVKKDLHEYMQCDYQLQLMKTLEFGTELDSTQILAHRAMLQAKLKKLKVIKYKGESQ